MEVFGSPLPVLVAELLTTSGQQLQQVSVQLSERGWAWLVSGRRLLVWRHSHPLSSSSHTPHPHQPLQQLQLPVDTVCRELPLPASYVQHRAQLVQLVWLGGERGGGQRAVPGCVAVSPEGTVRFWRSVAQPSVCGELSIQLSGEECQMLATAGGAGGRQSDSWRLWLATTTCSLLLLEVCGRPARVVWRRVGAASSLLGGLGRRVTSLLWWSSGGGGDTDGSGGGGAEDALVTVRPVMVATGDGDAPDQLWLLSARYVQCWRACVTGDRAQAASAADCLLGRFDVVRAAAPAFAAATRHLWRHQQQQQQVGGRVAAADVTVSVCDMCLVPASRADDDADADVGGDGGGGGRSDLLLLLLGECAGDRRLAVARLATETVLQQQQQQAVTDASMGPWLSFRLLQPFSLELLPEQLQLLAVPCSMADAATATCGGEGGDGDQSLALFIHDRRQIVCVNSGGVDHNTSSGGGGSVQALGLSSPSAQIIGSGLMTLAVPSADVDGFDGGGCVSVPLFCTSHQGLIAPTSVTDHCLTASNAAAAATSAADLSLANMSFGASLFDITNTACSRSFAEVSTTAAAAETTGAMAAADHYPDLPQTGEPTGDSSESSSVVALLRAASVAFCRDQRTLCDQLVAQLVARSGGGSGDLSRQLSLAAVTISEDILDDCPANDPRWADATDSSAARPHWPPSAGGAGSVIIVNQLDDKRCAHQLFVTFLQRCRLPATSAAANTSATPTLWQCLDSMPLGVSTTAAVGGGCGESDDDEDDGGRVASSGQPYTAQHTLARHHELLVVAVTLAALPSQLARLVDRCVQRLMAGRPPPPQQQQSGLADCRLTARDRFYRQVTLIDTILPALVDYQASVLAQQLENDSAAAAGGGGGQCGEADSSCGALLVDVSRVLCCVCSAVWRSTEQSTHPLLQHHHHHQQQQRQQEELGQLSAGGATVHSWMVDDRVRAALGAQHAALSRYAAAQRDSDAAVGKLYHHLTEITDLLLSCHQLHSTAATAAGGGDAHEQFEQLRFQLLQPLLEARQYERAAALAEKYEDFGALVEVCERTGDAERRRRYLARFGSRGFAAFVFNWFVERGACGRLLSQLADTPALAAQLDQHRSLRWLNELQRSAFASAAGTLLECAAAERHLVARKKTYLSLAKLCRLADHQQLPPAGAAAGAGDGSLEQLDEQLMLVELQQQLPDPVLAAYGLDPACAPVLAPQHTALLYTCAENSGADELQFVRALELCTHVTDTAVQSSSEAEGGKQRGARARGVQTAFSDTVAFGLGDDDNSAEAVSADSVRLAVWRRALQRDLAHSGTLQQGLDRPLETCRDMFFFRVVQAARDTLATMALDHDISSASSHLRPPQLEQLLDSEDLTAACQDSSFRFLLQAGYEHIVAGC